MGLFVSANGGNGLNNLFRQARPTKGSDGPSVASEPPTTAVSLRPVGRSGIDSTGSGTAQISAALTVCLSRLGGSDDAGSSVEAAPSPAARSTQVTRSGAADLMRVLDAYGNGQRLTA